MRTERHDAETADWPLRPWILGTVCALAGLLIQQLTKQFHFHPLSFWQEAAATGVAICAVSFAITVEQKRLTWAVAFALSWGLIIGLVGYFTASYNHVQTIFEWPFLSGLFAVLLAAPLFQTVRDAGAWRFEYARLHRHAWSDAVIGFAGLMFVAVAFLLAWLLSGLFDLIGIRLLKELLEKDWFGWMLAGFAFGSAVGLLRERDALVANLQRLVMVVLAVLAPVLAAGLALFLLSLPFTGLGKLWASSLPTTPMMLSAAAFAVLLTNAVIGDGALGDERRSGLLWRSALVLSVCVFPLAVIGAVSLAQRIGQHGWTPERIWGVLTIGVALVYGAAGWWAVARGRMIFDVALRPLQVTMALGLCALALFLALPILDFGAISARSQMDRLAKGRISVDKFDWRAMAFTFGPAGRNQLQAIADHGPPQERKLAAAALAAENRWSVDSAVDKVKSADSLDQWLRMVPANRPAPPALRSAIVDSNYCRERACVIVWLDDRRVILAGKLYPDADLTTRMFALQKDAKWDAVNLGATEVETVTNGEPAAEKKLPKGPNVATAPIEVRTVEGHQLYIDGKPVGGLFE